MEELKQGLSKSKYSLSIDNTTIAGVNICAMQVKYLKEIKMAINEIITEIKNNIIGLKLLKESSDGETLYNIIKADLLGTNEDIRNNFSGVTHDRGSNIIGKDIGALKQMKEDLNKFIFDLSDSCQSLNLALTKSLESLPEDTMKFIDKIHSYFTSPQRVSLLANIQEEEGLQQYTLCHYVKARWLSLGSSLKRLLKIWNSLKLHISQDNPPGIKKDDSRNFLVFLCDDLFYLKMVFLSGVISKMNSNSIYFQNQSLEVDNLAHRIKLCVQEIAELFINHNMLPKNISSILDLSWKTDQLYLMTQDDFIANIASEFDSNLSNILKAPTEMKNLFVNFCQNFLKSLLEWLITYLPLRDKIINILDFVSIPPMGREFKDKVLMFNREFNLVPPSEEQTLVAEINDLMTLNIAWVRIDSKGPSLKMWDIIESTYVKLDDNSKRFSMLPSIIRTAHTLPTSSSNIEQSFSFMKLLKSDLRCQKKPCAL